MSQHIPEILSPLNDLVFKALFSREQEECKIILMDFLNELLSLKGNDKIIDIEYMNPYNYQESYSDKLSILDIKVKTQKEQRINIEVQVRNEDNFRKRSLYYWSKLYAETISNAQSFDQLKKSIVINILKFNYIKETTKYHSIYKLIEKEEHFLLEDDLEIHYIELEKFNTQKELDQLTGVELWFDFFKEATLKTVKKNWKN